MSGFRKAERKKAKLRLGVVGPSGSGKTYSALLIAKGLGGRIAVVDTENGSADLYAGKDNLPEFDVLTMDAPYTTDKYIHAIEEAERAGYDVLILDSISHAWSGEGGLLDQQGKIADSGKGNSYTAWRTITPKHNRFVEKMLTGAFHLITTMRAKTEYALQTNEKGKQEPKKIGMAPIQREGMDYEFTVVLDLDMQHNAQASKDRTSLFLTPTGTEIFKPSEKTGKALFAWLNTGAEQQKESPKAETKDTPKEDIPDALGDAPEYPEFDDTAAINDLKSRINAKMKGFSKEQKVEFFAFAVNGSVTVDKLQAFLDRYDEARDAYMRSKEKAA